MLHPPPVDRNRTLNRRRMLRRYAVPDVKSRNDTGPQRRRAARLEHLARDHYCPSRTPATSSAASPFQFPSWLELATLCLALNSPTSQHLKSSTYVNTI